MGPSLARAFAILAPLFAFAMFAFAPRVALAAVQRFAVIVGNNVGRGGDAELRYAESDAARLYETLKAIGDFAPTDMVLLQGESAEVVRRSLVDMNVRVRAATNEGSVETVFLVYFSGHADASALHLGPTSLALRELEQLVRGSAATFRLLIVDACRSGALTRVKGGVQGPPLMVRSEGRLQSEGLLLWTSSAAGEDAQESDAIRGSFFSHYLNSALLGVADSDGDGRVTVEEAYRYASENTIRATSSSFAGIQHPTFRYELQGQGRLALTTPGGAQAGARASIVVPLGKPYIVFAGSSQGPVLGEVGADDRVRRLSVKPGRYFIRGRAPEALLEGEVTVGPGETRAVREDELTRSAYARLVRKGGRASPTLEVMAGLRLRTTIANGSGPCLGAVAGFAIDTPYASPGVRVGACRAPFQSELLTGTADEATVEARFTRSFDLPLVSLYLGPEAGVALFKQNFETQGRAPSQTAVGGAFTGVFGLALDLPKAFHLIAEVGGSIYVLNINDARSKEPVFRSAAAVRPVFGISKTW
jgi:hypothetical protein